MRGNANQSGDGSNPVRPFAVALPMNVTPAPMTYLAGGKQDIFFAMGGIKTPGVDHPVFSNCLESRYLKVLWARVA
jgi:hypothetical protein